MAIAGFDAVMDYHLNMVTDFLIVIIKKRESFNIN